MKKFLKLGLICFLMLCSYTAFAASAKTLPIGTLTKGTLNVCVNNATLETYNVFGVNYVAVPKLKAAGFQIKYTSSHEPIYIYQPVPSNVPTDLTKGELDGLNYTLYTGDVYIGHLKTQALSCDGKLLIPVASLNTLFNTALVDHSYILTEKKEAPIMASQTSITNYTNETVDISINDLYWDNGIIQKTLYFTLQPYESLQRPASSDKKYLTTIIATAVYPGFSYKNTTLCGQNNEELFKRYEFSQSLPDNIGDKTDLSTLYKAEETVNKKQLKSNTNYLVWTDLSKQKTFVFTKDNDKWKILKHFICSSGKPSTPTPPGTYKLTRKVPSFGQDHGYCCKNAFGFIGTTYLYHSILFDKTGTYLLEGRGVLGTKASDGCIRLSPENSKWFYDNLVSGSTVWIS